jgi:hypothetical protein
MTKPWPFTVNTASSRRRVTSEAKPASVAPGSVRRQGRIGPVPMPELPAQSAAVRHEPGKRVYAPKRCAATMPYAACG